MPLRTEIRVFYDFDKREVLYSANYWDYDYCRSNIRARADQIIFDALKDEILTGYEKYRKQAEDAVAKAMRGVNMTGKWSIDLLLEE
ncbi:hypothetical protein AGMMS49975_30210 [Clostridia bacterium]|nr:hypothetical protein AGMMS49975_30210 [Clostridia bacterium]